MKIKTKFKIWDLVFIPQFGINTYCYENNIRIWKVVGIEIREDWIYYKVTSKMWAIPYYEYKYEEKLLYTFDEIKEVIKNAINTTKKQLDNCLKKIENVNSIEDLFNSITNNNNAKNNPLKKQRNWKNN